MRRRTGPGMRRLSSNASPRMPPRTRPIRHEALTRAADLYEKAGNQPKTVAMLERQVTEYPTPVPDAIEVRERLAQIAREVRRQRTRTAMAKRDRPCRCPGRRRGHGSHPVPRGQRATGTVCASARRLPCIRLVAPLKKSLVAKRRAMEAALAAYKGVRLPRRRSHDRGHL